MCGGLVNQKLKESDLALIRAAYAHGGKDIQRGWLQDLLRKAHQVEQVPMGRDTWYSCKPEYINSDADVSPTRSTSSSSMPRSPVIRSRDGGFSRSPSTPGSPEHVTMETPARTGLANAVRGLLLEAPDGISSSALGLRLRRFNPDAVDAFQSEVCPDGSKPSLQDYIRSIPDVVVQQNQFGSEYYCMDWESVNVLQTEETLESDFSKSAGDRTSHQHKQQDELDVWVSALMQRAKEFFSHMCCRRKQKT